MESTTPSAMEMDGPPGLDRDMEDAIPPASSSDAGPGGGDIPREPDDAAEEYEGSDRLMTFRMMSEDPSLANAIRATIQNDVPTLAVDPVVMYENTSYVTDEMIALRLGLCPVVSNAVSSLAFPVECECDRWCQDCAVEFTLHKVCEKDGPPVVKVTTADVKSNDPYVRFYDDGAEGSRTIPLLSLYPGQAIHLKAIVRKGTGRQHAKWNPACPVYYTFDPKIEISQREAKKLREMDAAAVQDWMSACPRGVFASDGEEGSIRVAHPERCIHCEECILKATEMGLPDLVRIRYDMREQVFKVKGTGALPPQDMVISAAQVLMAKLGAVSEAVIKAQASRNVFARSRGN